MIRRARRDGREARGKLGKGEERGLRDGQREDYREKRETKRPFEEKESLRDPPFEFLDPTQ